MEKIQASICFEVGFLYENMGTCLFIPVFQAIGYIPIMLKSDGLE